VRNEQVVPPFRISSGTELELELTGAGWSWLWLELELMEPRLTAGTSVQLKGRLEKSKGGGQAVELVVDETSVLGECDPEVCNSQVTRPTRPTQPTSQGLGGDSDVLMLLSRFAM
jgi:hypothetical protein